MKKSLIMPMILLVLLMCVLNCSRKRDADARRVLDGMGIERKLGQMMIAGVPGANHTPEAAKIVTRVYIGGVVLFGYNLSTRENNIQFIESLQEDAMSSSGIPLFVSIDQEGGRVLRITDGVTQFPGNMALGVGDDPGITKKLARILGMQLRGCGVNMNLAPVIDVNNNPGNPVINTRSFGSRAALVSAMGAQYIRGLQGSLCIAVGKHFPGHGDTNKDSHLTLPVVTHNWQRLRAIELAPFRRAVSAGVEAIMTAHIAYPNALGSHVPATLSREMLTGLLRDEMRFEGLVITDDMEMAAVSSSIDIGEAAVRSVEAGADIVLTSASGASVYRIFDALRAAVAGGRISEERVDRSVARILELKLRYAIMDYENGMIRVARPLYGKSELALLERANEINRIASRNALYLHAPSLRWPPGVFAARRIFYTNMPQMREELRALGDWCTVAESRGRLDSLIARGGQGETLVYYHVDKPFDGDLRRIAELSRRKGITLLVVSTNNPFPLAELRDCPPTLFSFSNTRESLRQTLACLKGEFAPKRAINIDLGMRGKGDAGN